LIRVQALEQRIDVHRTLTLDSPTAARIDPADRGDPVACASMPYPPDLLNSHERVVVDMNPHWLYFLEPILTGVVALVLLVLFLSGDGGVADAFAKILAVVAIIVILWGVVRFVKWRTVDFVVTSDRVIFREGVFAKHGIEIPLGRVNNVNFSQGILERIVGAGNLMIESGGEDGQSHFTDIRRPQDVQRTIHEMIDQSLRRSSGAMGREGAPASPLPPPSAAFSSGSMSVADELAKLQDLVDRGTITPQQFEAQKQRLLGG
jgi:membrane protein YdbS with pleckstrin-like domain